MIYRIYNQAKDKFQYYHDASNITLEQIKEVEKSTGKADINNIIIFENDIVEFKENNKTRRGIVENNFGAVIRTIDNKDERKYFISSRGSYTQLIDLKIIGNIHQDEDLIYPKEKEIAEPNNLETVSNLIVEEKYNIEEKIEELEELKEERTLREDSILKRYKDIYQCINEIQNNILAIEYIKEEIRKKKQREEE